jgi:hypothetical protein
MGRHAENSGTLLDLRRTTQLAGLTGGAAWVVAFFLADGAGVDSALVVAGGALLTVALFGLGLLLVRSDVTALRLFVALALPTLVWGVFGIVHGSIADPGLVNAVFGAAVGLISVLGIRRQRTGLPRATL